MCVPTGGYRYAGPFYRILRLDGAPYEICTAQILINIMHEYNVSGPADVALKFRFSKTEEYPAVSTFVSPNNNSCELFRTYQRQSYVNFSQSVIRQTLCKSVKWCQAATSSVTDTSSESLDTSSLYYYAYRYASFSAHKTYFFLHSCQHLLVVSTEDSALTHSLASAFPIHDSEIKISYYHASRYSN